ncbi:hypothetical protein SRABI128_04026 [Microbacterium sp. Bi128]|nr:hypothetical protein SRABI128_04026 [Microbacterium sp. Bi128]
MGHQIHDAQRVGRVLDEREQVVDPALDVALAHAHAQLLVEHRLHRQDVGVTGVDAAQRDRPAAADDVDRGVHRREAVQARGVHELLRERVREQPDGVLSERGPGVAVGLHADRVDHAVHTPTLREIAQFVDHRVGEVEGLHPVALGHRAALGDRVDRQDAVAQVHADARRELPHGPEPHDRERPAVGDVRVLHALPGGRHDVAEEQVPVVGQVVADADVVVVGQRHPQVLGLPAGHLAVQLGEAEQRRAAVVLAHLRGLTLRLQSAQAHEAVSARDVEGHHDAVADRERRHGRAHLDDDAHGLVSEHIALVEERPEEFVQVQVGAADRRRRDLHDRVGRFEDRGVGNLLDAHVALALPGQCLHSSCLFRSGGRPVCAAIVRATGWLTNGCRAPRGAVTRPARRATAHRSRRAPAPGTRHSRRVCAP